MELRGPYPPAPATSGATERLGSKERKLAKKLPAGVPLSAIFIDEEGRADMSWRNVPDSEKPPGALSGPGHGKGKGVWGRQPAPLMPGPIFLVPARSWIT